MTGQGAVQLYLQAKLRYQTLQRSHVRLQPHDSRSAANIVAEDLDHKFGICHTPQQKSFVGAGQFGNASVARGDSLRSWVPGDVNGDGGHAAALACSSRYE